MTPRLLIASALVLVSMPGLSGRGAENSPLPVRDGRPVVATVGDGAIALDEFLLQLPIITSDWRGLGRNTMPKRSRS